MDCMKREMRRWDRDREWLARRFAAGWVCVLVALCLAGMACWWSAMATGICGVGLMWSTR